MRARQRLSDPEYATRNTCSLPVYGGIQAGDGCEKRRTAAGTVSLTAVIGALGATRTRGLHLRRVALYPLSYERVCSGFNRNGAEGEI